MVFLLPSWSWVLLSSLRQILSTCTYSTTGAIGCPSSRNLEEVIEEFLLIPNSEMVSFVEPLLAPPFASLTICLSSLAVEKSELLRSSVAKELFLELLGVILFLEPFLLVLLFEFLLLLCFSFSNKVVYYWVPSLSMGVPQSWLYRLLISLLVGVLFFEKLEFFDLLWK